jgi:hypothetical protein
MPQAVLALPYVAWILLTALAFGSFAFVFITRQLTDATPGYVRFSALSAGLLGLLALLTDWGLTPVTDLVIKAGDMDWDRQLGLAVFAIGAFGFAFTLNRRTAASFAVGLAAAGIGIAIAAAAVGWAPTGVDAVPLALQLVILSLVTGGSLAAIVLGHWYLVTPKISDKPLVLQCRLLLGLIALQLLLFIVWTTLGGGPGQGAFAAFGGSNLLLVVLRLVVTLVFPLVLTWMAWKTALTRSMESATGLLYINLAAVMAGTIGAAALYVSSGLLV